MNVVWCATTERDLAALTEYIAVANPQAALQMFTTIRRSVAQLALHPQLGRAGRVERARELGIPNLPYIVVYTITAQQVRILAVLHTARQWPESFPTE